jgi:hypothetical protein
MEIYQAILKAADRIERRPDDYNFGRGTHPDDSPGGTCALAWIGYYLGVGKSKYQNYPELYSNDVCMELMGSYDIGEFFDRCTLIGKGITCERTAPRILRAYAEKYHAPRIGLPDIVREIFQPKEIIHV